MHAQLVFYYATAPSAQNPQGDLARSRHQAKAVKLLEMALADAPDAAVFWADFVADDGLLNPIRPYAGFARLERQYGKRKR